MAHERKAYSISYQISTHKQVFVTLSSCIGLKRNIGGSVLRRVLRICHVTWPPYRRGKPVFQNHHTFIYRDATLKLDNGPIE